MSIVYGDDKIPYIDLGKDYKIRLEYEDVVDEKYLAKAKEELRETPENKAKGLKELKELIRSEKNFVHPIEDPFLETYLRPCKYYAESAHQKMQKYFKFKLKHKKLYDNITVDSIRNVLEDDLLKYMPLRDKEGRRILYIHAGKKWNPQRATTHDLFRAMQLSLQAAMAEPMTQVNGVCAIVDVEGLSIGQIMHFTPSYAASVLEWTQECIPIRLKQIYIVNNSYIFNMLFAIFKPFISAKLRKRIHFINKKYDVLAEELGKFCLNEELGGDLPVDLVDGKLLADFLKLFDKQFELIGDSGYVDEDEYEERKAKIDEGTKDVLSYLTPE
ncbi:alpha-tocopherol transfer protein-like [Chironomus tepperi]|uniref:alpha-tocopherol transfer protein-like n=1 Tax=Chironomus tepperi TaxID=113505 RepID=UPI00391F6023